ncbi:PilW family protein [Variovorax sp. J2P1-59]|uniref:PilW family protein n=1 Tax=Variovorax flavidus TaxID=3053501 RepID=UPI0025774722|nr:PilW family protein [Variovorax sp. J2P1-59]MDM0075149.1 PilW family protein [Variovorax sp. J2P1-59]
MSIRASQRGLTLVELLVAMAIGLVVTLAITSALTMGESHKRSTTSTNDMNQSGAYAAYLLDRAVRSAGSGFAQSWDLGVFGCKLNVSRSGTAILPRSGGAFPAPFAGFLGGDGATNQGNLRMAPLLIANDQSAGGSDVLVVMSGNGSSGDVPRPIRASGATDEIVRVDNTVGFKAADMALVSQSGTTDCLVEQVQTGFADSANNELLPLAGTYFTAGTGTTLAGLATGGSAYLTPLGNANAGNVQFQLFGVGANRTLFSYDLLRSNGTDAAQAIADGVMEMHALYGIDSDNNGVFDAWVAPDATGYDIATMMTTPAKARQVVAVRVALVLRSANIDSKDVSATIPALFSDTTSPRAAVALTGDARRYRYRVVEFTIPLRNILLLPVVAPTP